MSEVLLSQIEGYRPPAVVGRLDNYLTEHGANDVAAALLITDRLYDPAWIRELAEGEKRTVIETQDRAPWVDGIVGIIKEKSGGSNRVPLVANRLGSTSLTHLFTEQYQVDMPRLLLPGTTIRLWSQLEWDRSSQRFTMMYQAQREDETPEAFWQIEGNGSYGFANMRCNEMPGVDGLPLRGAGNIAFIPGVAEALTADVQLLR